ncbi:MAG: hypothetical protein ABIT08_16285 [Bacteroidia bacterium]
MAHSIVPHHHHEEENSKEHDTDHDHDNSLGDLFSHFQHFTPTNEIILTPHTDAFKYLSNSHLQKDFIAAFVFHFFKSGEQVPIIFTEQPEDNTSISHLSVFSLRGPPAFSA